MPGRDRTRTWVFGASVYMCLFGYTRGMDLILKLVAGLMAGLRAYFLLAAAATVAIPCLFFLIVFLVGLSRPSRAKLVGPQQSKNK